MDNIPSFRQAEMNAVSVLLGLTPSIIQTLGPTTVQTSVVSLRRPLLALMVALGTPAVRPQGAKELVSAVLRLGTRNTVKTGGGAQQSTGGIYRNAQGPTSHASTGPDTTSLRWQCLESIITYGLIIGCMANNAHLAYSLGCRCVCSFTPSTGWLPPLWIYLAGAIHLLAVAALSRLVSKVHVQPGTGKSGSAWFRRKRHVLCNELLPSWKLEPLRLRFRRVKPSGEVSVWFRVLAWLLFVMASMHVVLGLVVLASMMFISAADATTVIGRFIVCSLVCRFVVVREESRSQQMDVILEERVDENDFNWCTY